VPVQQLVLGKWLAAWVFASGVAALTLTGFVIAASLYAQKKLAALLAFGAPEFAEFLLLVVPFAAMTAAVQMLICTYGRSYREAQTYVSYLATVVSFVPVIVLFSGLKDAAWQLAVPVLAQQVVLSRVVRGDMLAPIDWLLPGAVAFTLAALCISLVARLLRDERIVFGRS
jgi:sodium transport system permease protein